MEQPSGNVWRLVLFLLTGCTTTPHSPHGTVASSQQAVFAVSQAHQECSCTMSETGLSLFRDGSPRLSSAAVVAGAFSSRKTPVTTAPAAKKCVVDFATTNTYKSGLANSVETLISELRVLASGSLGVVERSPTLQLLRRQRRWSANYLNIVACLF